MVCGVPSPHGSGTRDSYLIGFRANATTNGSRELLAIWRSEYHPRLFEKLATTAAVVRCGHRNSEAQASGKTEKHHGKPLLTHGNHDNL